jgi:uroporphyrinogen decarboxylase
MNRFGYEPDFTNFENVLRGGRGHRVPLAELVIDQELKEAFLGRPLVGVADEVEFRYQAGYDYAWVSVGMIDPAGTVNRERVRESEERHVEGKDRRVWADQHEGQIRDRDDLEAYPWPDPDSLDYGPFEEGTSALRPGMKLVAVLGKIFTAAWQLTGFERFCELSVLQPEFAAALTERVGRIQAEVFRRVIELDSVGAAWLPDDIAFHTGTLLPPEWFRRHVFPFYRQMNEAARRLGKPVIFHSDGDMSPVLEDILEAGFDALHPIEPESMDIYALRKRVGMRLCLVGNISVNTLSIGTPEEIRALVKDRVTRLGHDGAYCVGSSNSVPNYVPFENYLVLLQASAEHAPVP